MDVSPDRRPAADEKRVLDVVGVALLASVLLYVALAWFLTEGSQASRPAFGDVPEAAAWVGVAVAVLLLLAAQIVVARRGRSGGGAVAAEDGRARAQSYRTATIFAFALQEGAALVGLLLALLTGNVAYAYALGAAAVVAMFLAWPRQEHFASGVHPS